ncbi:MAG: triphosphoribosyl-dephospho-CoA synthase [Euryarchaeota archaeon]|nr:triphosphoribosyl-dephospho-CoA synthase [Euryarchaeota archaeon]
MDADTVAGCASLAMLLEVSGDPKPGNVDREHDYAGTRYEHFLASAVGVYPVFRAAAASRGHVGRWLRRGVEASRAWQQGGNTHFGTLLLLTPLAVAAGAARSPGEVQARARRVAATTTVEDAVEFYRCFEKVHVRLRPVEDLDVYDPHSIREVRRRGLTLRDILRLSVPGGDRIAGEWLHGFPATFRAARRLAPLMERWGPREAAVRVYMELMAEAPDTLVAIKRGRAWAERLQGEARRRLDAPLEELHRWDRRLLAAGMNPGTTADLLAGGLFAALLRGYRP